MANRFDEAVSYFQQSLGLTLEQARGIVGNLVGESNLDPKAVGDGGLAYGVAQWHPDRQANFKKAFGIDIRNSTFQQQLEFVRWELLNTEKKAFEALLGENTIAGAVKSFMKKYERPANMSSYQSRLDAATKGVPDNASVGQPTITDKITSAVTPDWLENLLNGKTAARWASVVIGIILIGLAIAAFVLKDNISNVVKEVAA